MFEWQTLLEPKHLPTPSCSDLYLAREDRAVGFGEHYIFGTAVGMVALGFVHRGVVMHVFV